jgi:cation diffusion facilitator family transporter
MTHSNRNQMMQWVRDHLPDPGRERLFRQALWITLLGNVLLALTKGVAAYLSGSVALYADAANSSSDVVYSLLMIAGLWLAHQPPDLSHPQGHSRFEPLAGVVVAAAMTFAGVEAIRAAVERFIGGGQPLALGLPTVALLFSAGVKAGMFVTMRRIAREVASPTLAVAAKDNLSDVLTSIAAFIGVFGAAFVHPLVDPAAGVLVGLWILRAALEAWRENLGYLTGAGAPPELRERAAQIAAEVPGVEGVHQVILEYVGPRLVADLHVNMAGGVSLDESHAVADAVQARLESLLEVDRAYVHVEPIDGTPSAGIAPNQGAA